MRVGDVTFRPDGAVHFYMARSKTDKKSEGLEFTVTGSREGGISVRDLLREYISLLRLKMGDCLFPRATEGMVKDRKVCVSYAVAYRCLEKLKTELGLSAGLTWHCFRIGAASRGAQLGVSRGMIKEAGLWKSEVVDLYMRLENPGVVLSEALLRDNA